MPCSAPKSIFVRLLDGQPIAVAPTCRLYGPDRLDGLSGASHVWIRREGREWLNTQERALGNVMRAITSARNWEALLIRLNINDQNDQEVES